MAAPSASGPPMPPATAPGAAPDGAELRLASRAGADGTRETVLSVPNLHCGACVATVEAALAGLAGVRRVRANLTARRVSVHWQAADGPPPLLATLAAAGYPAHLPDRAGPDAPDAELKRLLRALAVAGFGAGNIMLLSVAVWSGADPATRDLFHWLSAAIAAPVLAWSGQPFFRPALAALRRGRSGMDVPISLGILLAFGLSLYDTATGARHAWFDAAVTLVFFLLAGRALEAAMRRRARSAAAGLRRLEPRGARVIDADGEESFRPIGEILPGMRLRLRAGELVPVDGRILAGTTDVDTALITGESLPRPAGPESELSAGSRILTAPIELSATRSAEHSFLAGITRMVEAAEDHRSGYRQAADRVARVYAPVVHLAALASLAGWLLAGGSLHEALTVAVAVLIITCPCALGLAAPLVQAIAARQLFRIGVLLRQGDAMERLAGVDTVLLDKTGVVTSPHASLLWPERLAPDHLALARALAARSSHPFARAITALPAASAPVAASEVRVLPGDGIEAVVAGDRIRLGRPGWATGREAAGHQAGVADSRREGRADSLSVLSRNGVPLASLHFASRLRKDARPAVAALERLQLRVELLSGDRAAPVRVAAEEAGIEQYRAELRPAEKRDRVAARIGAGGQVLMVGDGANDAAALAAANVSMAPAEASEIGRAASDLIFLRESLAAVPQAIRLARRGNRLMRQNFALAILYNAAALPLAAAGQATPLVAAIAMSSSSLLVAANSLRLTGGERGERGRGAS